MMRCKRTLRMRVNKNSATARPTSRYVDVARPGLKAERQDSGLLLRVIQPKMVCHFALPGRVHAVPGGGTQEAVVDDARVGHSVGRRAAGDAVSAAGAGGGRPVRHPAAAHRQRHLPRHNPSAQVLRRLSHSSPGVFYNTSHQNRPCKRHGSSSTSFKT